MKMMKVYHSEERNGMTMVFEDMMTEEKEKKENKNI